MGMLFTPNEWVTPSYFISAEHLLCIFRWCSWHCGCQTRTPNWRLQQVWAGKVWCEYGDILFLIIVAKALLQLKSFEVNR